MLGIQVASKRKRRQEADVTPERLAKAGAAHTRGDESSDVRIITMLDSPLEQAHLRKDINNDQFEAGKRYRQAWFDAGFSGSVRGTYLDEFRDSDGTGRSFLPATETMEAARHEYRSARQRLGDMAPWLELVVCYDHPVTDLELFRKALDLLSGGGRHGKW